MREKDMIKKADKKLIIKELKEIGLSYEAIGKSLGISKQRVEQLVNSNYVSLFQYTPKKVKGKNIITLLMRMQGLSVKRLAETIGISQATLYNKVYAFQDGSSFHKGRYFSLVQAKMVADFFKEKFDVLFEKIEIPVSKKGRKIKI